MQIYDSLTPDTSKETLIKVFPYGRLEYDINNKEHLFEIIDKCAYRDMQPRHFKGIGGKKAEREKIFIRLADKFYVYFQANPMNMEEYDEWHKSISYWLHDEFKSIGYGDVLKRGKAQKLINMSMKHFYLFSNSDEEHFIYAHVALDRYTLEWYIDNCPKFEGFHTTWSRFDDNVYQTIQDNIRKCLSTDRNNRFFGITPFKAEFYMWEDVKSNMKNEIAVYKR